MITPSLSVPTPVEPVRLPAFANRGIELYVKRDDLIHPRIIGNKLRKSLAHFKRCRESGHSSALTFGGRFSNHLLAIAQAGQALGLATIGVVRGTDLHGESSVLDECRRCGMRIITVSTQDYYPLQQFETAELAARLGLEAVPYLIPEGGTSSVSIEDVGSIVNEIAGLDAYDYIVTAVGTGGTAAGLVWGLSQQQLSRLPKVLALAVLKGYTGLPEPGLSSLREKAGVKTAAEMLARHLVFDGSAPWGRYGKPEDSVMQQLRILQQTVPFPLDYVYTGKVLLQLEQMVMNGRFARRSRLLFLHTGGYQTAPIY